MPDEVTTGRLLSTNQRIAEKFLRLVAVKSRGVLNNTVHTIEKRGLTSSSGRPLFLIKLKVPGDDVVKFPSKKKISDQLNMMVVTFVLSALSVNSLFGLFINNNILAKVMQ